ncbi:hypothetical protein K504DRAFT_264422 [Pleomassaria siparia CBS 279.74]|uniref:Secreted protein n=1 Tax=Pleomassaria siparia CBS 279.74 TaxID=1314801 RepID=A0A6G1KD07_9PLEO|nr:hypothetical protein K504DRAFT_264422 [Pleomassaria siparia CBS 279.74]
MWMWTWMWVLCKAGSPQCSRPAAEAIRHWAATGSSVSEGWVSMPKVARTATAAKNTMVANGLERREKMPGQPRGGAWLRLLSVPFVQYVLITYNHIDEKSVTGQQVGNWPWSGQRVECAQPAVATRALLNDTVCVHTRPLRISTYRFASPAAESGRRVDGAERQAAKSWLMRGDAGRGW